jgi:putative ABC transport system permease protein
VRLTAKLAYSQIKINRSRTMWTVIGIALSTALITTVCSFAASIHAIIISLYGETSFPLLLLIIAGFLCLIILSMSVVVISNAFRVSAGERRVQFGILKSVGATKEQITESVVYESVFLSSAGIPIGIVLGLILTLIGVEVANRLLDEINSLVNMMLYELTIELEFIVTWQAITAAVVISFLAVLYSAWLPARKAASVVAIESIRGTGQVKLEVNKARTSPLISKLFGFEGTLAAKNMKRSRRNFRASVISLVVAIVLLINLSALTTQVRKIEDMIYPKIDSTVIVDYTSDRDGRIALKPISSELGNTITERLRKYEDTDVFGSGYDNDTYTTIVSDEEVSVDIIIPDSKSYASLCEKAGVAVGSNIILNHYSYNDNGVLVETAPFSLSGQNIQLLKEDGEKVEIAIHGELTKEQIPEELFGVYLSMVRIILPEAETRFYSWYAAPPYLDGFMSYANSLMSEFFPQEEGSSYMELGFTTRAYEIKDYAKIMNIGIILAMVFVYSFGAILTLIGLTSVISTLSANVRMRAREFAVLQSVGMTPEGLRRMLNLESIMCSAKALVIGLPLAVVLTYLINLPIRSMFPIPYQIPWVAIAVCIAAVFAITWITMQYAASRLRRMNIVETIRL